MAQIRPRGPNREFGGAWRPKTLPRRGSDAIDGVETFQMRVNDAPRSPASSTSDGRSDTIKRRLVEEYNFFRSRESERPTPAGYGNGVAPNYNEMTSFSADRTDGQFQAGRSSRPRVKTATGKVVIPQRPVESTLTRSEYNDRIMDYRGGGGGGVGGYPPPSISAITSPTGMRGVYGSVGGSYSRSSGQPSPSSVIEELQGRFSAASRSREKRPTLRPNPTTADLVVPAYHRKTATSMTTTATLVSKPHHQSDLTLPTTPVATLQSINATSTARIPSDASSNATLLRNAGNGAYRGGPSFRRLQTLYGTNISQKRYPSDNALDMTYLEDNFQPQNPSMPQFYISDRKAGTVKIQVRSRSEQGSPNNGVTVHSPQQGLKFDDRIRSEQVIQPKALASAPRTIYSPPRNHTTSSSVDGPQAEDEENQVLPSVREIIRQVEEMTLKNSTANSSTSSLSKHQAIGSSQHISRSLVRPVNAEPQGSPNRSQSASAFRPANPDGVNIQANSYGDAFKGAPHVSRRTDQLTNLPQDYQKLLEAFLEQRKEIQRLRKEMVEKDRLIAALQKDIHMYEPWR
ncbi:unnamed protein product [Mesocestoides corti]|uniref:Uncharacterized protein n=1 Tax=Mesocestoides corti TaxID=53468 RepID=A0A0R3UQZ3_MESCO|nr:unnamed protein product [Mesocestoides corti]